MNSSDNKRFSRAIQKKRFENNEVRLQTSISFNKEEIEFLRFMSEKNYGSSMAAYIRKLIHEEMDAINWNR